MQAVLKIVLLGIALAAGAYDLRYRRIPNWLNLSGLVVGFGVNAALSGWHGTAAASLGMLCALVVYVPLYLVHGMGAGDVKLMAAVGAMVGPGSWLEIFLVTAIIGGVVSLVFIAAKKRFHQTVWNLGIIGAELSHFRVPSKVDERLGVRHPDSLRLPHGAVIAAGCVVFCLHAGSWI